MSVIRYSEEDLFNFAFKNTSDIELLDILIREFGLDINWRGSQFYDTLLYQSFKTNVNSAKYLISKGACVNASLGGYPVDKNSHGYMSIMDAVKEFNSLNEAGGVNWLKKYGAVSFENLTGENKDKIIKALDFTKQADDNRYVYRTVEQIKLSAMNASLEVKNKLESFVSNCPIMTIDEIENKNTSSR